MPGRSLFPGPPVNLPAVQAEGCFTSVAFRGAPAVRNGPAVVHRPLVLLLVAAAPAFAQMEGAHRQLVDAGVHVPVLTRPPTLLQFVQADYPPEAAKQGLSADVRLIITIDKDGTVPDAKVK